MSDAPLQDGSARMDSAVGADESDSRPDPTRTYRSLRGPMAAIGFWSAIVLPFLYIPLLATEFRAPTGLGLFVGLVVLHLAALLLGRSYRPD